MVHITQQFRGMVTRHIDHVVIDRNQVLDFVSELGKNLMQVERQLIFSLSQARENHQANEGFHVKLQTQMEDIEDAFHPGRTLEELRRLVFSKLKAIKSALECKQDEDERRIQETHQKMGELQSTLHSMKKEIHVVLERARTLEKEASRDALTGIHNRRAYETRIQEELQRFHRYNQGFSLVLFDVDHFKRVNDQYGHRAGDKCLKEIVNRIKPHLRKSDFMARYGGEEFMIILPGTSKEDAYRTAEKIRLLIERTRYVYQERDIPVTISLGVTSTCPTDRGVEGLFARVDGALYQAKNSGRNRTCVG
jgi:diguanylate cyclase (GGDEF)-like protein